MKSFFATCLIILFSFNIFSQDLKVEVEKFCNKFIENVQSGNLKACLKSFDKDYRKVQHDQFLKGNTTQFIEEFLYGYMPNGQIVQPKISNIQSMKIEDIAIDENGVYIVQVSIQLTDGTYYITNMSIKVVGKKKLVLQGALG